MPIQTLGLTVPEKRDQFTGSQDVPFANPAYFDQLISSVNEGMSVALTEHGALSVSTCYACTRVLADSVSSLPLKLYRKTNQGRIQAVDQPLHYLLSQSPNEEMTASTFFSVLVTAMALTGNGYAEIERTASSSVVGLWPLHPHQTYPIRLPTGKLAYRTSDGEAAGSTRVIAAKDILAVPLFPSFDGVTGLSPLQLNRETFGHARVAERFGKKFLENFAVPSAVLTTDAMVKPEDKVKMRADFQALQTGANLHRIAVLDQGMKIARIGLTNEEAQYLETRRFLREEIAAIYRVPAHMIGDNTKLANASVEGQNTSFVVDSLRPYLNKIEAEIIRKLVGPVQGIASEYEVEFDVSERLRGDVATATNYYKTAIQFGWMCPNDVRRELNLNEGPEALNVFQTPVNMMNSEMLLEPSDVQKQRTEKLVNNAA